MCLRETDISLTNKEHSGSGHAKASPSGSVHKTPFTSESFYFILLREVALFPISGIQPRSVRATQNRARTSCATLALCSVPWDGSAPMACSSQVSLKFTHEHVYFIKFLQSFNVISKLLCPWSDVSGQCPHAAGLGTCPFALAQTSLLTLADGKSRRSDILLAQRRIMSSIAISTSPLSVFLFVRNLFSFLLTVPILLVIAKSTRSWNFLFLLSSDPYLFLCTSDIHYLYLFLDERYDNHLQEGCSSLSKNLSCLFYPWTTKHYLLLTTIQGPVLVLHQGMLHRCLYLFLLFTWRPLNGLDCEVYSLSSHVQKHDLSPSIEPCSPIASSVAHRPYSSA